MANSQSRSFTRQRGDLVSALCEKYPDAGNHTLARKLHKEHPRLFPTIEGARDAVRYRRGNHGDLHRKQTAKQGHQRPNGKGGQLPKLPVSLAKPWEPFVVEGCKRVLVISDLHIPFHDNTAIKCALKFGDKYKPDTILINGDLLDFQAISRFARDPRGPTVKEELDLCSAFLRHLRKRFPKARIVFKLGNHDERWEKMLWLQAPVILDVVEFAWHDLAGFDECGVEVVGEQRIVMLGKLPVLHGHEMGKSMISPVNPARGAFLRTFDSLLVGHSHRTSDHTERSMLGRIVVCWSTGALCDLHPDYAKINKWDQGFATVDVEKDGCYQVELKRIIEGSVR